MAIEIRCAKCKAGFQPGPKNCPKCGASLKENKRYRVRVKLPDGKWFVKSCLTLAQAKRIEAKVKTDTLEGEFFKYAKTARVADIWKKYLKWARENKRSWNDDEQRYELHIKPSFEGKQLSKITPVDVENWLCEVREKQNRYGEKLSPQTVKHVFNLLRRIYNWSKDRNLYGGPNPCEKIKLPAFDNSLTNFLGQHEQEALLRVLDAHPNKRAALVVKFAMFTGKRQGEILALKWSDIDLGNGLVTFQGMNTKNRKTQVLPLNRLALRVLREAKQLQQGEYVFPSNAGGFYHSFHRSWRLIRERAGLGECRFHDLRHTFASNVLGAGSSLYSVQKLLGHKTGAMTQRYAHIADKQLLEAANSIEGLFPVEGDLDFEDVLNMKPKDAKRVLLNMLRQAERATDDGMGPEPPDIDPLG